MGYSEIWAPWRMAYVTSCDQSQVEKKNNTLHFLDGADETCFICQAVADTDMNDRARLVIRRSERCISIMNRYPYNNGHLLVAPCRHVGMLELLTPEEHADMMAEITRLCSLMKKLMHPDGFNVGLNLGRVAGAGLPGHLHWHIVPRWNGDTNFMPVLAGVNVIPQSLEALWEELVKGA